jgi:hypothetical protein
MESLKALRFFDFAATPERLIRGQDDKQGETQMQLLRCAEDLHQIFGFYGYYISPREILHHLHETDVQSDGATLNWVEASIGEPGSIEDYPCLVFCRQSIEPGSAVARSYRPI